MRRLAYYCLLVLGTTISFNSTAQRTCGTGDYFQKALLEDPGLKQRVMDAKNLSDNWLNTHPDANTKKTGTIITIPVVVHVLYENSTENISDAQVQSQIDVLNDDYRKLNADTGDVPIGFQSVAADVEVVFCLAVRDPSGDPTTGITRTSTTNANFGSANPKSTADGGKDGWPNSDYLNFWVCDLGGGLLGYATFPGGQPSQDGVVCGYQYIGKPPHNPFGGSFNKGRTATHEVGHYLGLSHSFQSGCSGTTASNCASAGDGICDTPPTSNANYGCPSVTQNTCTETPVDQNDMHMNYMDYVDDGCMNLFTDDQKARMRSVLSTSRLGLQNSLGCLPINALDASVELVTPTDTVCGSDQFAPVITLSNYGSTTITTATIYYNVDFDPAAAYTWTGSLAMFESVDVSLPMVSAALGAHTFTAWTTAPNGGVDELLTNDTTYSAFTFMNGNSVTLTLDYGTFQLADKVSWDIRDGSGAIIDSSGGYSENTINLESICLEVGCYTLAVYDIVDNGVGSITMVDVTGDTIVSKDDIYSFTQTFCVTLPPPTVSVDDASTISREVSIFPNPSTGQVLIANTLLNEDIQEIVVQNIMGQIVYTEQSPNVEANTTKLDLAGLPDGIYFITLKSPEYSSTKKVSLIR